MNKIKKWVWIPIAVVGVIVIAAVIMSFIRISPVDKNFGDFTRVEYLYPSNGNEFDNVVDKDNVNLTDKALREGLDASDFSVMQALLEYKYSYKLALKTQKDEDGNEQEVMLDADEIAAYGSFENQYVIQLYWEDGTVRSVNVEGKEIKFDRVLLRLYETNGEIEDIECVPYLYANIGNESDSNKYDENGRIGSDYYKTNVLYIKMNTSRLMMNIAELNALYN